MSENSKEYGEILKGIAKEAGSSLESTAKHAGTKREAKEARRRKLASLLNSSLNRNQESSHNAQEHNEEMNNHRSHAMQNAARGFVNALSGSTRRTK